MWIDELPGFEYYLMLFYEGEFLHLIIFFPKKKEGRKRKTKKNNNNCPTPKNYQIIFAWLLKDSKSQNKKHN